MGSSAGGKRAESTWLDHGVREAYEHGCGAGMRILYNDLDCDYMDLIVYLRGNTSGVEGV